MSTSTSTTTSTPLPSQTNFSLTSQTLTNLTHLSHLLHLLHHRNRNQHRHSVWYRPFSTFRQHLSHLLSDLDTLNTVPATHAARMRKLKFEDPVLIERIRARLDLWRDVLVGKWHLAFGQVVADQRFGVVGLVLMAVLAEVCMAVGITVELEERGEEEVRRVIEAFGEEVMGLGMEKGVGLRKGEGMAEDVGEVLKREEVLEERATIKVENESKVVGKVEATGTRKRSSEEAGSEGKKKRKKRKSTSRNVIDEIFG